MKKEISIIPLVTFIFFLMILGCASEPKNELAAAKDAIEKAREAQADRYAPDLFALAENSLTEAEDLIAQKKYSEAKQLLMNALGMADSAVSQASIKKEDVKVEAGDAISESQKAMQLLMETQEAAQSWKIPNDKTDLSAQMPTWDGQLKQAQDEFNAGNFDVAKDIASKVYQELNAKNNELSELIAAKQKK